MARIQPVLLAKKLAKAKNPEQAARVRELIALVSMESDLRRRILIYASDHEP
jgi:hypothetical protein